MYLGTFTFYLHCVDVKIANKYLGIHYVNVLSSLCTSIFQRYCLARIEASYLTNELIRLPADCTCRPKAFFGLNAASLAVGGSMTN